MHQIDVMKQIPGNNRNTDILNPVDSRACVMQHIIIAAAVVVVEYNTNIYIVNIHISLSCIHRRVMNKLY